MKIYKTAATRIIGSNPTLVIDDLSIDIRILNVGGAFKS